MLGRQEAERQQPTPGYDQDRTVTYLIQWGDMTIRQVHKVRARAERTICGQQWRGAPNWQFLGELVTCARCIHLEGTSGTS